MTTVHEDYREHMYKDKVYHLIGSDGWVDIKTLTVHIAKSKNGVRVEIYPAEHDGASQPLASCEATYTEPTKPVSGHVVRKKK